MESPLSSQAQACLCVVQVFDRTLVLYDCDEFTREWGRQQGGLQEADFVPLQVPQFDHPYQPLMTIPPNVLGKPFLNCGLCSLNEMDEHAAVSFCQPCNKPSLPH